MRSRIPGNDDLGATSSWLVWAMLGLYPELPGTGGLTVASPAFPDVTVHLAGGQNLLLIGLSRSGTYFCLAQLAVSPAFDRGKSQNFANINTIASCTGGW